MVTVRLFAAARQLAGTSDIAVALPETATVADLKRALATARPALAGLLGSARIAVNAEYAPDTLVIPPGAELAVIPPVSGG
jgi:molybdopterin converting factor subunit 1